ncbi:hypothetical protein AAE02nite_47760 [Adhaeribacter aerolatus]|uniref:Glycosyltransferase subfamily 4-like N-terminal domain-containing protein n=1 Tax=Adhaeribacter aerolatus TaxID=670289 RepID=A0A512B556_9BACT|nr:glycosyltransferase family 4 protein [Adhaeribacter aerolatus]GEO07112.1 hypothetical protein AAE02nite_47760 [Adhaeribacter aerolatus]
MKIMILGWEKPFSNQESTNITSINTAEALAKWVKVSLILPQSDKSLTQRNIKIIGLNNISLEAIPVNNPKSEIFPFANQHNAPAKIPLYGTPVYSGQETAQQRTRFSGEAVSTGSFMQANSPYSHHKAKKPNLFLPEQFNKLNLPTQIIQYARYTSRFAYQINFDLIYAHDLPTFLAGTELKLRTGKKLVVQVSDLTSMRTSYKNGGWLNQINKYGLEKSDVIIAENNIIANELLEIYGLNQEKIITLQPGTAKTTIIKKDSLSVAAPANNKNESENLQKQELLNQVTGEVLEILLSLSFFDLNEDVKEEKLLAETFIS